MATNKYNRGMPIIQRTKPVEVVVDEASELKAVRVEVKVIPITFRRRIQPIAINRARVRATRSMSHTFFWALAS
jgi:hypothetical protein